MRWYRSYLTSFPQDPQAAQNNFLLAELLYEDARYSEAAVEYEKSAYGYPQHAKSADAGYAALLAYAQQEKRLGAPEVQKVQLAAVDSALRFSKSFPQDPRGAPVLTNAAEKLYALNDGERASAVARQVLALQPPPPAEQRRVAWTVVAHTSFEKGAFVDAERAYGEVLALTPEKDACARRVDRATCRFGLQAGRGGAGRRASCPKRSGTTRGWRAWRRPRRCAPPRSTTRLRPCWR